MTAVRTEFRKTTGGAKLADVRRRRRGAVLEDAIRQAAFQELIEVGYDGFTIDSVATRAQTGKASIYRRWSGKQDLVLDSFCCGVAAPLMGLDELALDHETTTRDGLIEMGVILARVFAGPAGDAVRAVIGEAVRDPSLSQLLEQQFQDPRETAMMKLIQRGIERGEVRPEAANELIVEVLPAMLIKRVLLRPTRLRRRDIMEIIDTVVMPLLQPH